MNLGNEPSDQSSNLGLGWVHSANNYEKCMSLTKFPQLNSLNSWADWAL